MAVTTVRSRPDQAQVTAPLHPDGTSYRYEMVHSAGARRSYADEPAELVAALIPGYAEIQDPVESARARIVHAVHVQVTTQAAINVELGSTGCSPEEREVLSADRAVPPAVAEWTAPVPLILVDCFYAPVTDLPKPVALAPGEILWLRPGTDWDHLRSLAGLGVITLAERTAESGPDRSLDRNHHSDKGV
jgi:hypothetical protein